MIIVASGDSFTWGSELGDESPVTASQRSIPALLSARAGHDYRCVARPGAANSAIARCCMNACHEIPQDLFVYVMWSFTHRYEFRFNYDTETMISPWHSINLWDTTKQPQELELQREKHPHQVADMLATYQRNSRLGINGFAEQFYKHVGNSEYYEFYTSLKEIVFLQQYLRSRNIGYLFTVADCHFKDHDSLSRHLTDPSMSCLYQQIDWEPWFWFPAGTATNETCTPRGFYQWAMENKYPVGVTHPLAQAHQDAAKLMEDKFNELVENHL